MRRRSPSGKRRTLRALILTLAALVAGVAVTGCIPRPPPTPTVVVYGDSLVHESSAALEARLHATFPGWTVIVRSFGGLAQCDWHNDMVADADQHNVRVAIIAFVGNAITSCSANRAYPASYTADANWAADLYAARGIPLAFVATPGTAGTTPADRIVPNIYRSVGTSRGVAVIDFDDLFVDPATGRYEQAAPCLVGECDGYIVVRGPDGGHLCLIPGQVPCMIASSGIVRYVDGIIQMAARLGHVPAAAPLATVAAPAGLAPPPVASVLPEALLEPGAVILPPYSPLGESPP